NAKGTEAMQKTIVDMDECKPGMRIAETIRDMTGKAFMDKGSLIQQYHLIKLRSLGIRRLEVYVDSFGSEQHARRFSEFKLKYDHNVGFIRDMLNDVARGGEVNIAAVNGISEEIVTDHSENMDVIRCLGILRHADEYTYSHCVNVSLISMLIAKWLSLDEATVMEVVKSGVLHDIGKAKVPGDVLNKQGDLTDEEFAVMKGHTVMGHGLVADEPEIPEGVKRAVLEHHEREDGTGYPHRKLGSEIHLYSKIVTIADIYDAMTSERVYKKKQSPFDVFAYFESNFFGYLDPIVVRTFYSNIITYYVGDNARLTDGSIGEIVFVDPKNVSRPMVKVDGAIIDLKEHKGLKVEEIIW
ncbi:MAG: HD-GYP domain-containing protein, partial [Oscillospiraceae bacterium]|nr:HD-GYP domain-containing protein [Oscillospiraceae bacterium]